jgi:hypothetical protein
MGAAVRGDARIINNQREYTIEFSAFKGSSRKLIDPKKDVFLSDSDLKDGLPARTNEDYFLNLKAQGWWSLRRRFLMTYRAIVQKKEVNLDEIISLPSNLPFLKQLTQELSQPAYKKNESNGKMMIDKMPKGARSPNLADAVMIAFAPESQAWSFAHM